MPMEGRELHNNGLSEDTSTVLRDGGIDGNKIGKNSRNTAIALISIFTLLQVFMSWLLFLQFFTIIISYIISNNWFSITEKKLSQKHIKLVQIDAKKRSLYI